MRKTILLCLLIVTMHGLFIGSCYAEEKSQEKLQVVIPNRIAKLAYQILDRDKLLVSALDADENPIRGLNAEDFVIRRGTKEAKIFSVEPLETSKELSLNVVLVVDNSFSMVEREAIEPLLSALEEFFKIVRPIDNIHLVVFNKERSLQAGGRGLHAKAFSSGDTSELRNFATDSFDRGLTAGTFLYEAMLAGIDLIRKMPEKSNKFFVVFSDGEDLSSSFRKSVVEDEAKGISNFEAYAVDYMPGPKEDSFLKSFAETHGGRIWKATSATELLPIFKSFSTTLLHRYVINYRFLNPPKGTLAMKPLKLDFEMLTMTDGSPIPTVVFFETGKSKIPDNYVLFNDRTQIDSFNEKTLRTPLERYYNVLNIIGKRLSQNPKAKTKIMGCNSGVGVEKKNLDLSWERAEAVQEYLTKVWGITSEQMEIGARNLPANASPAEVLGGSAENQRVEIEYVPTEMKRNAMSEFVTEANNVNEIKINPQIVAEYGIANWELNLLADNQVVKTWNGAGDLKASYTVLLDEFGREKLANFSNLQARIEVTDTNGDTHETNTELCPISASKKELIHELIGPPRGSLALEPDTVTIEELTTIDTSPMLNYVFFETGKSDIPERYVLFANQADTKAFSESGLKGTMEKYLHILNIIGKRLVDFPEAQIRIVGCNADFQEERGKIDLSRSRAERVRAYLKYIWGIDSSRMTVEARNLPAVATTNRVSEGRAENQRVEIYSDFPAILDPIKSTYVEEMSDTEELRVFTRIQAGYGTASWKLQLMGDGDPIESLEGEGDLNPTYIFDLMALGLHNLASYKDLAASIEVVDKKGQIYRDPNAATSSVRFIKREERVAQKVGYKVREKYALILFDFDSSDIKERNKAIVEQIIERMKEFPAAEVKVVGHTDIIGKEQYNLKLSERRAKAVYNQVLATGMTELDRISYTGVGPHDPLYDNSLPEGRALNRTVTVSLEYEKEE